VISFIKVTCHKEATAVTTKPERFISFDPESFEVGGGAIPSGQLLVKTARFKVFDYNGRANPTFSLQLVLVADDNQEYTQYYSAGDPNAFQASEDGRYAVPTGANTAFRSTSNVAMFFGEAVNCGFPANKLAEGDIGVLDGWYAEFKEKAQPERAGLEAQPSTDGRTRKRTLSVPVRSISLPWEASARGAAPAVGVAPGAAVASAAVAAPGAPSDDELNVLGLAVIEKAIADSGGTTAPRETLAQKTFEVYATDGRKSAIMTHLFNPVFVAFLQAQGYTVDTETISKS
jgi:hypothetical protein